MVDETICECAVRFPVRPDLDTSRVGSQLLTLMCAIAIILWEKELSLMYRHPSLRALDLAKTLCVAHAQFYYTVSLKHLFSIASASFIAPDPAFR